MPKTKKATREVASKTAEVIVEDTPEMTVALDLVGELTATEVPVLITTPKRRGVPAGRNEPLLARGPINALVWLPIQCEREQCGASRLSGNCK
jgi:hypothetical protein